MTDSEVKNSGGRPGAFKERAVLAVYVDRSMIDDLKKIADGVPLSTYVRKLVLDNIEEHKK